MVLASSDYLNKEKPKVLVVSFFLAPSKKVGGKRFTFLSEVLNAECSELHFLTLDEKKIPEKDYFFKSAGTKHFAQMYPYYYPGDEGNVLRKIFIKLWIYYLCLVDPFSGWIIPAIIKGLRVIKDNEIDIIISTCPPFSAAVIGYFLSRMTSAKLILDYRDPWSNIRRKNRRILRRKFNELLEQRIVKHASAAVFCSRIMMEDFKKSFGKYTNANCYVITNGFYDKDIIKSLTFGNGKKNLVYSGTFYGDRKIELLAKPLSTLLKEEVITKDNFCIHIFGKLNKKDLQVIKKHRLYEMIIEKTWLPYEKLIKFLKGVDILLLLSGSDVKYAIPFKFFDYLSVKRPILTIAPENSAMSDLMDEIDCGRCASINSEESILTNLRKMLFENTEYSFSGAEKYTWENLGKKYLKVINEIRR
jgi:glycosyltransferase involved in cell wall biosynthesis